MLLFVACNNKSDKVDDKQEPVIYIASPSAGQVFTAGQTVGISAPVTDNNRLAQIHVHISNNVTGQLIYDIHHTPNGPTYTVIDNFQAQAGTQYKIQIVAVDMAANQGTQSVLISVN